MIVMVCIVLFDSVVVMTTGFLLSRRIKKAVAALEQAAHQAVGDAAEEVKDQLLELLPHRPGIKDLIDKNGVRALSTFFAGFGVDTEPLEEMSKRVFGRDVQRS